MNCGVASAAVNPTRRGVYRKERESERGASVREGERERGESLSERESVCVRARAANGGIYRRE